MKRFYGSVAVAPEDGGMAVLLDGKPVRTPAKRPLLLPTQTLAEAVAEEWRVQGEVVKPQSMPLTQLCCTALDLAEPRAEALAAEIAAYGATDLLCYRAEAPAALVERQARLWQPLLDWAAAALAAPLAVTGGLVAVEQPPASLAALARAVAGHQGLALTALSQLVGVTGSLVLGLAVSAGRLTAAEAFELAELDGTWQMELWGADQEALDRRARQRADLEAAARLLALARRN
jgi:chaperone required for assembly of F1-ATPase